MAPSRRPVTLYNIALSNVSSMINQACNTILLEYGSYGTDECNRAVDNFQKFLIDSLPQSVFEELAENRNLKKQLADGNDLRWCKDARIKLAVFLHSNLSKFSVDGNVLEQIFAKTHEDWFPERADEIFWSKHLAKLINVVSLNLNPVCTDEILFVIGQHCSRLESINITCRIKQQWTERKRFHFQTVHLFTGEFRYCVSDAGLNALSNCKMLKSVTMNKINFNLSRLGITSGAIKRLARSLEHLEYFNFGSTMGQVLLGPDDQDMIDSQNKRRRISVDQAEVRSGTTKDMMKPLRLRHFHESSPNFVDVPKLVELCPYLSHLILSVPVTSILTEDHATFSIHSHLLSTLSETKLPLEILELQNFHFNEDFERILSKKGPRLKELRITLALSRNAPNKILQLIGEWCPNLEKLDYRDIGPLDSTSRDFDNSHINKKVQIFKKLKSFRLLGGHWEPTIVLPLVLKSAHGIREIQFANMGPTTSMDGAILKLLDLNTLPMLTTISLLHRCSLSLELLRRLIFELKKLTRFIYTPHCLNSTDLAGLRSLKQVVRERNLDVDLCYDEN